MAGRMFDQPEISLDTAAQGSDLSDISFFRRRVCIDVALARSSGSGREFGRRFHGQHRRRRKKHVSFKSELGMPIRRRISRYSSIGPTMEYPRHRQRSNDPPRYSQEQRVLGRETKLENVVEDVFRKADSPQ